MSGFEIALVLMVFGAIGAVIAAGTGFAFYISNRVSVIETRFNSMIGMFDKFGKKAIDLMHSPHTPELDALIEKVRGGTDTDEDWLRMLQLFQVIEKDLSNPKAERALAWFATIECKKHLKMPIDPQPHVHSETTTE